MKKPISKWSKPSAHMLEELVPEKPAGVARYKDLITFVQDRPGHDVRYAIDAAKIGRELGWNRRKRSNPASAKRCNGIWTTKPGGKMY